MGDENPELTDDITINLENPEHDPDTSLSELEEAGRKKTPSDRPEPYLQISGVIEIGEPNDLEKEEEKQRSTDDNPINLEDSESPVISVQEPKTSKVPAKHEDDTQLQMSGVIEIGETRDLEKEEEKQRSTDDSPINLEDSESPVISVQEPITSKVPAKHGDDTQLQMSGVIEIDEDKDTNEPLQDDTVVLSQVSTTIKHDCRPESKVQNETKYERNSETLSRVEEEVTVGKFLVHVNSPNEKTTGDRKLIGPICPPNTIGNRDLIGPIRPPNTISDRDFIGPILPKSVTYSDRGNQTAVDVVDLTADGAEVVEKCIEIDSNDEENISETGEPSRKRQKMEDKEGISAVVIDLSEEDAPKQVDVEREKVEPSNKENAEPGYTETLVIDLSEGTPNAESSTSSSETSVFSFKEMPKKLTGAWSCYKNDENSNYLKGCKWAPDGTCLMTSSCDNVIRVFNLPEQLYCEHGEDAVMDEMVPVLKMKEADTVYDYCWFPLMSSSKPETACLAVTSKGTPVHLYDAFTGDLRCSYRAYDHLDELVAAHCISFDLLGNKLFCGFNKMIRVFDVSRPGRECQTRPTFAKAGQRGIISCITHSPSEHGLYAAGSYSRSIALYQDNCRGEMLCMFEGQQGGVTQVTFSPDGTKLYSGGRKDNEIICWDLRNPGHILFTMIRSVQTNQRMYFDITSEGRYVISGCHDGKVVVWDIDKAPVSQGLEMDPILEPVLMYDAHQDTANGISLHPSIPVVATASGQRHYANYYDESESDENTQDEDLEDIDNSLKLWWMYPNKT